MYICIFGGGPTGLRLADELSKQGHNIELHDKESKLGGCWKVDWENGYYREHSPRVMSSGYKETLKILNKYNVKTENIYGSKIYTTSMFLGYIYNHLSFMDISKFIKAMYTIKKEDKRTLKQWFNDNNITKEGQKALNKLGLSLATNQNEMLAYIFFTTIKDGQGSSLIQSKDNDLWISRWEKELSQRDNIKIFKDSKLIHLKSKNNIITEAKTNLQSCKADIYICSFPLYALSQLVKKCDLDIKSNWMDYSKFNNYCIKSSYSGLGFQLHFTEKQKNINIWKSNTFTDWNIEILQVSNYSDGVSKNTFIKDVWSCVIVDTNSVSKYLNKKVNDIDDINIIINESIRQLSLLFDISVTPYKVTIAEGVFYDYKNKFWDMEHSAYNPFYHPLPPKGNIENLYSVGPHNLFELTVLESAFKSADNFVKTIKMESDEM